MNQQLCGDVRLCAAAGVMACPLGEGVALLHQASGTFYTLGEIETFIWNRLSSPTTSERLAIDVGESFDAPPEQIARDVHQFLESMVDADLVELDATAHP